MDCGNRGQEEPQDGEEKEKELELVVEEIELVLKTECLHVGPCLRDRRGPCRDHSPTGGGGQLLNEPKALPESIIFGAPENPHQMKIFHGTP